MQSRLISATIISIMLLLLAISSQAEEFDRPVPEDGGPTVIHSALAILDVDEISSVKQSFTVNLAGVFRWNDPRLTHAGPGVVKRDPDEIWNPRLFLMNEQRTWSNFPDIAEVAPNGDVTYRMFLWGSFSQSLDLHEFPMDRHTFSVPIVTFGYSPDEVLFIPHPDIESYISESLSVPDWTVYNARGVDQIFEQNDINHSAFIFEFEASRRYGFYLIKAVIPLFLIVAMSWVVFWIDPKESGSQLTVSVTTILTLIAYHIALSSKLPDIHYLTRMDLFLFGATMLVFASLIEVVVTSRLANSERLDRARRIDEIARWVFPGLFVLTAILSSFI
jgi:hypothetical protein